MSEDKVLEHIKLTLRPNKEMDKIRGGPYTEEQIEYAYGIAKAIMVNVPKTIRHYQSIMMNQVNYILMGNNLEWGYRTRMSIRSEIIKLGDEKLRFLVENMIEIRRRGMFKGGITREELTSGDGKEIDIALWHGDIEQHVKGKYKIANYEFLTTVAKSFDKKESDQLSLGV